MSESALIRLKLAAALLALAAGVAAVITVLLLAHSTPSAGSTSSGPQAAPARTLGVHVTAEIARRMPGGTA
jgi:hypothetical protein